MTRRTTRTARAAATPNRSGSSKRSRGRPPKAVVPAGEPTAKPAAAPPADVSTADAMAAHVAQVRTRAAAGARLENHESRILREIWLHDMALHVWPSLDAAAADLGVSASSLRAYREEGCPGIEAHQPIPKSPVLHWLLKRAHERGGERHLNRDTAEEADARWKLARAAEKEKTLVAQAEDRAQQGLLAACTVLKTRLTNQVPSAIVDAVAGELDRQAAEHRVATIIEGAIADSSQLVPPTPEGSTP